MSTTDTDALKERINDAFLDVGPWRAAVEAVMRHEGYTEEEIKEAYGPVIHTNECTDHGFPFGYDCTDDEGRDLHPLHTRSQELDNTYRLFFEESDLATAILPIVEAEVRAAKAEAWHHGFQEGYCLEPRPDWANALSNPYRETGGQT